MEIEAQELECKRCGTIKSINDFVPRKEVKGANSRKYAPYCRPCKREYDRLRYPQVRDKSVARAKRYYNNNLEKVSAQNRANLAKRRQHRKELLHKLKDNPCMDCGGKYPPYCMDWDHLYGKIFTIGEKLCNVSEAQLMAEIAKCELVCSNCYRIRTHNRKQGYLNQ